MTMYGINDNDIMDEVMVSDMIYASKASNIMHKYITNAELERLEGTPGDYSDVIGALIDSDWMDF